MNTLFITHHYLSSNGGGSFASRAYINAFAQLSSHMTLLYPVKEGENLFEGINPDIEAVPVEYNVSKLQKFVHLLFGKVHRYFQVARKFSNERSFDIVVFDTSIVSFRLIELFKQKGCRVVVIHHNYQYEYFKDNTPRILKLPTLFWCKKYEGQAVRKADLNLCLTRQDIKLLSDNYNSGNSSGFRLLGTFEYRPTTPKTLVDSTDTRHRFVITGNLGAIQTKRSLIPWIKDYYPILKQVFPDASLTIAGKSPDEELTTICKNNKDIKLIPSPVSMDSIMENADYYVCPICLGGGIKLRIMDGLKWGLPVVASNISVRGYDDFLESGNIYPYSDMVSFKSAILELKHDNRCKAEITDTYRRVFSYQSGLDRLFKII